MKILMTVLLLIFSASAQAGEFKIVQNNEIVAPTVGLQEYQYSVVQLDKLAAANMTDDLLDAYAKAGWRLKDVETIALRGEIVYLQFIFEARIQTP